MDKPLTRVRAATADLHEALEAQPYARAVLDGSLPIPHYASFLRALAVLHAELEVTLEVLQDPSLRTVFDADFFARRQLLERDLTHLQTERDEADAASLQALVLAQRLRLAALKKPATLLGAAYVIEGSQLGNLLQRQALEKRPEFALGGLAYLAGLGSQTRARFTAFVERFEAALRDDGAVEDAVDGARATFGGFAMIFEALDPARPEALWLAPLLNPDAGMHAIPHALREVRAALRAGEQSYAEGGYYRARYGDRGLRFTRSDSAWLATLAREGDESQTLRQVHWLARVLAARGMPRILLEQHLTVLHEALRRASPQEADVHESLGRARAQLRHERLDAVPDFDALVESVPASIADERGIGAREAATLLVAAVADEKCGVANAVSAILPWITDPALFGSDWNAVMNELVAKARAATR